MRLPTKPKTPRVKTNKSPSKAVEFKTTPATIKSPSKGSSSNENDNVLLVNTANTTPGIQQSRMIHLKIVVVLTCLMLSMFQIFAGISTINNQVSGAIKTTVFSNDSNLYSYFDLPKIISATATTSGDTSTSASPQFKKPPTLHILQCLMGKKPAFIAEWEVSLKSILINAPLDAPMQIHILADSDATKAIFDVFENEQVRLVGTIWRNQITITVYEVSHETNQEWTEFIKEKIRLNNRIDGRVTLGGYYRLLAHKVIPEHYFNGTTGVTVQTSSIENNEKVIVMKNENTTTANSTIPTLRKKYPPLSVVYMDVDVVVLGNMNPLLQQIDSTYLIQAATSKDLNSGFMVINLSEFDEFWTNLDRLPKISSGGDQSLVTIVQKEYPDRVGRLPTSWDVHMGHGWRPRPHTLLSLQEEEGVDMLHFTGSRSSAVTYWTEDAKQEGLLFFCKRSKSCSENSENKEDFQKTWGLADYYIRIPWSWVLHLYGYDKLPLLFEEYYDDNTAGSSGTTNPRTQHNNYHPHGFPLQIKHVNV